MTYVGRFAPSPTGPLHMGSLVTAAASYLHARQHDGKWQVRIDDIDPYRRIDGAADHILQTLDTLELRWDGPVIYQSHRHSEHKAAALRLLELGLAFRCVCPRNRLKAQTQATQLGTPYPGTCRDLDITEEFSAIRLRIDASRTSFVDGLQGEITLNLTREIGDFVIWRRDAVPAYHLAVVLDDALEGVTDIVRGYDLLFSSVVHTHLYRTLKLPEPAYWHVPIIVNTSGEKLSKQDAGAAIDVSNPSELVSTVLGYLGLSLPAALGGATPAELWAWAEKNWEITTLNRSTHVPLQSM